MIVDMFLVYKFIKLLSTPFNEWDAYSFGIIDAEGNILRRSRDLKTQKERSSWNKFDLMVLKIKRILEKMPGGKSRTASYAAALYLIKESENISREDGIFLSDEYIKNGFLNEYYYIKKSLCEEAPTNSAGSGNFAGLGIGKDGEPGLTPEQMKRYKKKKEIIKSLR